VNPRNAITVGRIAGIEIAIHATWLLVFGLVSWSLAQGYFPARYPGWDTGAYWLTGALTAVAFFASVLLHELGHSLVAQSRGVAVRRITLFIFGGVSDLAEEPSRPLDEFLISIVGPLTSFALAAVCWGIQTALGPAFATQPAGAALAYLAYINLIVGAFNLLPGFPLDGGRVLRSIVWALTNSLHRATQVASYVGQAIGFLLIYLGITRVFGGAFLDGMWIAFIGWFLSGAAEAARHAQAMQSRLRGLRVQEMMDTDPAVATVDTTLHEFVYLHVVRHGTRALPVVERSADGSGDRLIGLVSVADVKEVPQPAWATTRVVEVMSRLPLVTVAPETTIDRALRLLVEHGINQVPVVTAEGRLAGMVNRADVLRTLQLGDELKVDALRPARTNGMPGASDAQTETPPLRRAA
jgi:Zn-dependent protease/CBS domain-containing protein